MTIKNLGRIRHRAAAITVTGLGVAATVLFSSGAAQAATLTEQAWTSTNKCLANLYNINGNYIGETNSNYYAQAGVYQSTRDSGYGCEGWLQRSTDGGATWSTISGKTFTTGPGDQEFTGWYYDGPGYKARACAWDADTGITACTKAF
ncbi:hypothetical protein [Streptomyces monashensis]|uniref:hypothetical protein n=1 Tax=Streptomyces monashensis TaxID=1678012 RepID=UPI001160D5F7|nr:hypothetical protein [Streptomyces monashensis]